MFLPIASRFLRHLNISPYSFAPYKFIFLILKILCLSGKYKQYKISCEGSWFDLINSSYLIESYDPISKWKFSNKRHINFLDTQDAVSRVLVYGMKEITGRYGNSKLSLFLFSTWYFVGTKIYLQHQNTCSLSYMS